MPGLIGPVLDRHGVTMDPHGDTLIPFGTMPETPRMQPRPSTMLWERVWPGPSTTGWAEYRQYNW